MHKAILIRVNNRDKHSLNVSKEEYTLYKGQATLRALSISLDGMTDTDFLCSSHKLLQPS